MHVRIHARAQTLVAHASPVKPTRPDPTRPDPTNDTLNTSEHRLSEFQLTESPQPRLACETNQLGNEFRLINKHTSLLHFFE
jgi:hypothetical protein